MKFDIAIIGGGHAGAEAAWIASEFGLKTVLLTLPGTEICLTPCNPSIGGVGKGQVVRELDALGGLMPLIADAAAIHYRTLNEGKGYAVQSTRVQIDKNIYSARAKEQLLSRSGLTIIYEKVQSVIQIDGNNQITTDRGQYVAKKLVITGGTYFAGKMHTGDQVTQGGSSCSDTVDSIAKILAEDVVLPVRFKTGTPARISHESIDYSSLVKQESDLKARCFHYRHQFEERFNSQIECFLTETNDETLSIIRKNKSLSPLFNGQIAGVGPRYCPSIEDKAFRYPDKNRHHVFLERETLEGDLVYPSGLSTSLPCDIQEQYLRTIKGLEKCTVVQFGYAVEYDVVDTTQLERTLESRLYPGVYFAGQINGSSGYEEAAAQGFMAGVNAALAILGKGPLVLDRNLSYIGVLVEDLVSSKRDEPYRLFTARSENRLFLREDNAITRMYAYRKKLGLAKEIDRFQECFMAELEILGQLCDQTSFLPNTETSEYFVHSHYGPLEAKISLSDLLRRSHLDPVVVLSRELSRFGVKFDEKIVFTCAVAKKYEGYIRRQNHDLQKYQKLLGKRIEWEVLAQSKNISVECRQRIKKSCPQTFSQLQKIEGIRPATLAYVASIL